MSSINGEALRVMRAILGHLVEHADREDTLEEIAQDWMSRGPERVQLEEARRALEPLVQAGLITARRGGDSRIRYRIDPGKLPHIRKLLGSKD